MKLDKEEEQFAFEKFSQNGTAPGLCLGPGPGQAGSSERALHPVDVPGQWEGGH